MKRLQVKQFLGPLQWEFMDPDQDPKYCLGTYRYLVVTL
jgi:hypothetical protein